MSLEIYVILHYDWLIKHFLQKSGIRKALNRVRKDNVKTLKNIDLNLYGAKGLTPQEMVSTEGGDLIVVGLLLLATAVLSSCVKVNVNSNNNNTDGSVNNQGPGNGNGSGSGNGNGTNNGNNRS